MGWIIGILAVIAFLIVLFLFNFYRDPKREIPKGNIIVAPADGRVISIIKTNDKSISIKKGLLGKIRTLTKDIADECYVISIFMSPLDVHINRSPIEGTIKSIRHAKGKFFRAYELEKSLENEKNEIIIENKGIKVKVIQVAGFLARRIKCYAKKNQKVNKGDKIGMIALSSQTTIVLPAGVDLRVKANDKVKAGESIIAYLRKYNG
ncbi:phosphatidylserine decarboxylase [Candidatus Woesearchaeota archaeon]|nr:phosphatidylserine decarboxylase [Candidatus Woesearchaeota archaeon]